MVTCFSRDHVSPAPLSFSLALKEHILARGLPQRAAKGRQSLYAVFSLFPAANHRRDSYGNGPSEIQAGNRDLKVLYLEVEASRASRENCMSHFLKCWEIGGLP